VEKRFAWLIFAFCFLVICGVVFSGSKLNILKQKNLARENKTFNEQIELSVEFNQKPSPKNKDLKTSGPEIKDLYFPKKFFFGTAYSDFQTAGIDENSDWHDYVSTMKPPQMGPGVGNDFFNRYREDFDLADKLGIQVHRISLEWSRFEPKEGNWDMKTVAKYKKIFAYMRKKGIEPMICLNHFPVPKWFADKGGWENNEAPFYFMRYAEFVAKNIGIPLKIKWWLTLNEPQYIISVSYAKAGWPPFKEINDLKDSLGMQRLMMVTSHVMDAHRLAYRAIHQTLDKKIRTKPMVGFASAVGSFYPANPNSPLDQFAFNIFNFLQTLLFDYTIGNTDRDFIGLNYYGRTRLKMHVSVWKNIVPWLNEDKPIAIEWDPDAQNFKNGRPKEFFPQGLYDTIIKFKELGLPIIITENGLDDEIDKFREEFIVIHLKSVHDAIKNGANVIGYQYWSLADTWEPGDAKFSQMGLIKIERDNNLKRSVRPSAWTYAKIIKTHKISRELLRKYGGVLTK